MSSHRWVECANRNCANIRPSDEMTDISRLVPGRQRGVVCPGCRDRLREIHGTRKEANNGERN